MRQPVLRLLLLLQQLLLSFTITSAQEIGIPAELLATALNHAASHPELDDTPNTAAQDDDETNNILHRLQNGDIDTLHKVAKSMNSNNSNSDENDDRLHSIQIFHQLADSPSLRHIPSMLSLGFAYSEHDKERAARYFVRAGEDGPHQAALYNAGRLYVELEKPDRALAYLRSCAHFGNDDGTDGVTAGVSPKMTAMATEAYHKLSNLMREKGEFTLQQIIHIFPYASIDDFPLEGSVEESLWNGGIEKLNEFVRSRDGEVYEVMRGSLTELRGFEELSELQKRFVDDILREAFDIFSDQDEL